MRLRAQSSNGGGRWTPASAVRAIGDVLDRRPWLGGGVLSLVTATVLFLVTFAVVGGTSGAGPAEPVAEAPPPPSAVEPGERAPLDDAPEARNDPLPDPVRVLAPSAGIEAPVVPVGLTGEKEMEVPPVDRAGWYTFGPRPGEVGPAVVVGHVDSHDGPAIFFTLETLVPGDEVVVVNDDETRAVFEVYDSAFVSKDDFPTEAVYGDTEGPELRLITCGGSFDREARSYDQNLVVWARSVEGEHES